MSNSALLPGEDMSVSLGPAGVGVVFKLSSKDTGGLFSMVEHPLWPGTYAMPHLHHNEDEHSYVLEGEVAFQLGEKVTDGTPGALIAKPRGIWHTSGIRARSPRKSWRSSRPRASSDSSKRWPR
jgi:quercetin dioxygenase-like cupin family protein